MSSKNKDETIEILKHDMRGSSYRELNLEKIEFENEANRLRSILDDFIVQIGGIDRVLNFRQYLDQQQEFIKDLENQKDTQQQIYDAKYDECLKLEKKLLETEMEREDARRDAKERQRQTDKKQSELDNQLEEYRLLEKKKKESEDSYKTKIKAIEGVLSKREKEIEHLNSIIEEKKNEIEGNEEIIEQLNNDIVHLNEVIKEKEGIIANREKTIHEKSNDISELKDNIKQNQKEHETKITNLLKKHADVEANYKGQIDTLEKEIVNLINEKNNLVEENENKVHAYQKKLDLKDEEIEELHKNLKIANSNLEKVASDLEREKTAHLKELNEKEDEMR